MREGAKRRLAGAVVIVALAVIFVPMLFQEGPLAPPEVQEAIPSEPDFPNPAVADAPAAPAAPTADEAAADGENANLASEAEPLALPAPAGQGDEPDLEVQGEPGQLGQVTPRERAENASAPKKPRTVTQAPAAKPAAVAKPAPTTKEAAKPRKEVVTEPPQPPEPRKQADGMPSWVVQVSSLGSSEAADKLAGKLKQSGFSSFVEKAEIGGKFYYRVRVGPDVDRANAERTAAMLRQQQKLDTLIQRYP